MAPEVKKIQTHFFSFHVLTLALVLFLSFVSLAFADEILLENGDRLTGKVKNLSGGVLTFETDYSKPVLVIAGKIMKISTEGSVDVYFVDGRIIKGKFQTGEDGRILLIPDAGDEISVSWDMVKAVNPPAVKWTANINIGASLEQGNSERASIFAGADAGWQDKKEKFQARTLFNYAEEDNKVSVRNIFGAFKYDHFISKSIYAYLGMDFLSDKFKDLNLRSIYSVGLGYVVLNDLTKYLSAELGTTYIVEDFDEASDDEKPAARAGLNFRYSLKNYVTFSDIFSAYQDFADDEEFLLRNEASLTSMISGKWSIKFSNVLEYDNAPPPNVENTDTAWIISFQYRF